MATKKTEVAEQVVEQKEVKVSTEAVADYMDIDNPAHANKTYAELQALAKENK